MRADQGVGVGWVADDNGLAVTCGVVVDGLAHIDEDSTVVLEEVGTLHAWATGLGTDEEVVVDIPEGRAQIARDHDFVEEWEGAIVKLSLDTLEDLLLERQVEQVQDDTLVLAQELTTIRVRYRRLCWCLGMKKRAKGSYLLTRRF